MHKSPFSRRPLVEELEPRLLFSADLAPLLADALAPQAEMRVVGSDGEFANTPDSQLQAEHARFEVVFIDPRVQGHEQLLADIQARNTDGHSIEVVLLASERDGVVQIGEFLSQRQDIDAIHLISHGSAGSVQLGSNELNFDSLLANASAIKQWGNALSADADILIYGCDLAGTEEGQSLVDALGSLTGADVAASDDLTGSTALGGDWVLEYRTGVIETPIAVGASLQQNWAHVLAVAVDATTTGTGTGSSITVSHTTSGLQRLMLVGISMANPGANTVSSVTWNGRELTFVEGAEIGSGSDEARVEVWHLLAPQTGTANLVVNFTGAISSGATVGVTTFTGVDQTTPIANPNSNTGTSSTASVSVASTTDDLVFSVVNFEYPGSFNLTPGGSQTELWDLYQTNANGGGSTQTGATSTSVSWSNGGTSSQWALAAVSVRAGGATANNDTAATPMNTQVIINVAGNDIDPQGDTLTVLDLSKPSHGTATSSGGNITYTPTTSYTGSDSLIYRITDGNEGLTHYWKLDGSGTDSIGSSDGTLNGGPTTTAGRFGDALQFDESNDYVLLPDLTYGASFTLSFDFNLSDNSGSYYQYLYSHGNFGATNNLNVYFGEASEGVIPNKLRTSVMDGNDTATYLDVDAAALGLIDGNWHTYTLTVSSTGGAVVYLDGVAQVSNASVAKDGVNPTGSAYLGAKNDLNIDRFYGGKLDSVALYNSALSAREVAARAAGGRLVGTLDLMVAGAASANTVPGAQTTIEDTARVFSSGNGNQISIADSDAGGANNQITLSVSNGTLTLAGTAGLSFVSGDGTADATMTFRGTASAIDTALNGLSYSPTANWNGTDTLTVATKDSVLLSLDIDANLKGRYTFENTGALGTDTSPAAGYAGTPTNASAVVDSTRGNVLSLAGNGYIETTGHFGNPTNATLAAWVNLASADTFGADVISLGDSLAIRLDIPWDGVTVFYYDGTTWHNLASGRFLAGTGWHHVAYTFNDTGNAHKLYIDGVEVASAVANTSISYTLGENSYIGKHANGETNWDFNGLIDDARVYSRVLTASEIATLATDLAMTDTDTVAVTVAPGNDAPANTVPGAQTTIEDTARVFSSGNGNQISIADSDAGGANNQITLSVSNGTLTLAGTAGLSFVSGDGTADATMTFRGTASAIDTALNGLSYSPTANWNGTDTLTVATKDSVLLSLDIDANLKGRYTFENTGALGTDTSPAAGYAGTPTNASAVVDSTRGNVLSLAGNGYIETTGHFGNPTNATLAAWVNLASADTGGAEVISLGDSLAIRLDDIYGVTGFYYDGSYWQNIDSNRNLAGTGWHHVAYTFNDTGDAHKLYIDGVEVASATASTSISYTRGANSYIGKHGNGSTNVDFNGLIDDARVYSRVLTASEIATLANDLAMTDTDTVAVTVAAVNDAPTFGIGDGIVTTAISANADSAYSVAWQPDGKIIVAGISSNGSDDDFALARYNADGSLDTAFGGGDGIVTTALGAGNDSGRSVTLQPDGKIVVAGISSNGSNDDFALVRYNADGSLDMAFGGGDGIVTTALGADYDTGQSVTLQPDGKIVVAGASNNGSNDDFGLVRYNADGSLDTAFGGGDGIVTTALGTGFDYGQSVTLQPDGKIVVAGISFSGSNTDFALVRYNADGSLDTAFGGGDGIVTTALGAGYDSGRSVTLQPDGKIVVAGAGLNGSTTDFALVRYNADGSLDMAFGGGDGIVTTALGADYDSGQSVTLQPDGKIVVAGASFNGSNADFGLVRYNADGSLDTAFGGGAGVVTTALGASDDEAYGVTLQPDGKIVVAGYSSDGSNTDFALVRYNADGSLDSRFDSADSLNGSPTFVEGGAAVVLDANVQVYDPELSAADNFSGAALTLARNGGTHAQDVFSATGTLGSISAASGNLVVGGTTVGAYTQGAGTLVLTFNANATNALVNEAMRQIAYSNSSDAPAASAKINWTFDDGNSGAQGTGGTLTATGSTTVNITAVNDAPVLAAIGNQTVTEGNLLSFTASASDADVPANTLTYSLSGTVPAGASISAGGVFTWTPTEAQGPGSYSFDVIVSDGTDTDSETITVTVNEGTNQAPVLAAIGNQTVTEGNLLSFTASASDADVPANTLTYSLSGTVPAGASISAGGVFTWTPTEAQGPGSYSFDVIVSDGTDTDSETITVTVNEGTNQAPVLAAIGNQTVTEGNLLSFTASASDADVPANTLTYSLSGTVPAGASISAGGVFTWTPTEAQGPGSYSFDVIVSDGTDTDSETITVTVNEGTNQAPVLAAIGNQTVTEGNLLSFTASASDADVPANTLTYSLSGTVPAGASISAGGVFTWTPTEAQGPGSYSFDVIVSDGTDTDSETITVTVNEGTNQAPVLAAIGNQTVTEGNLLSFTASASDADVPANTLTYSLSGTVPAGASISAGGVFTWTPTEAQGPGSYSFDVIVSDGTDTDSETITVTVNEGTNQAPVLAAIGNQTVTEGNLLSFTASASDADVPANTLTYSLSGTVPAGASISAGGVFTWTPTEAQGPGSYSFDVIVSDGTDTDSETITVTVNEGTNQAPVLAAIGNQTVTEGNLLSFTASASDADVPANTLTYSLSGTVPAGASISAGGVFTWTPTEAQGPGSYSFDVIVSDGTDTDSETITVTVNEGTNQAPVLAAIGNQTVTEGNLLSFTASASDADVPANTLTYSLSGTVPAGASISAGGVFTWTPTEAQGPGSYSFDVIVSDGTDTDSETITVTVNEGTNQAPVLAAIGNQTVTEGNLLSFTASASDADVPANTLTYSLSGTVPAGASISAGGVFTWTPTEAQGPGSYSFDVIVSDGTDTDSETITVTVNEGTNQAPVLAAIGNQTVTEGNLLSFTASASDADVPANTLTYSLSGTVPAGASISAGGVFTWTPTEAQGPGSYSFDVIVSDGTDTDSETITVTVNEGTNQAPVLAAIGNQTVTEGNLLSFTASASDADVPANTLTYSLSGTVPAGASISAGGVFTWTPTEAQGPGSYSFDVIVSDGTDTDSETITVTVNEGTNQAPVLAAIGNQTVTEGNLLSFTASASDADVPANTLTYSLSGTVPAGASISAGGVFTWTPTEAQGPGSYSFDVIVSDGTDTDSETITVTVNEGTNQAPVLAAIGNQTVTEGNLLSFTASASDADVPANTLTYSLSGTVPAGASISAGGVFTWTPTEAQGPGSYSFDVIVSDGTDTDSETITVTVNEGTNQAPVLAAIGNQTVTEGNLLSFTASASDADVPANTLTYSLSGTVPAGASISAGGVFTWTPTEAQGPGSYSFDVIVSDGTDTDSETITVTVNEGTNQAPVLAAIGNQTVTEGNLLSFTASASDADVPANTLTYSLSGTVPAGASISAGGVFTWTPTEAQGPGSYSFDVIVSDGTDTDSETITVTVNEGTNQAPVLAAIGNQTVTEGNLLSFTASASDADVPANTLTYSLSGTVPAGASISAGGVFTWTPTEAQGPGSYSFDVIVSDGTDTDSETITVTVNEGTNQAPVLAAIGNQTVTEGNLLSFTASASDADVPANTLTYSLSGTVPAGASISAGGVFTWTPTEAQGPGSYSFDVIVSDGTDTDSETITVTVNEGTNQAPVLAAIGNQTVTEGNLLSFTASASDADVPANTLTYSLSGTVPAGASISAGGVFTWTPTEAQGPGSYSFDVIVSDGTDTDSETITVTVNEGTNQAPVLAAIGNQTVTEGNLLSFTASASDADVPANTLTYSLSGTVPAGASISAGGVFTWTPTEAQGPGSYSFDVIVSDGTDTDSETITVTVNEGTNQAPVLAAIGNQTVTEGNLLSFTASASDADVPANTLTYSLSGTVPAGASISAGGVFTWTPTEAQGPGSYSFDVIVSDGTDTDSETITVTVNEGTNQAPVLAAIGNQTVTEGNLLSFTASASDADVPANTLTYSLSGTVPAGASISAGGVFTWTPTEAQGPGSYSFDVIVSDGTDTDSETITVTVNEGTNQAPVLAAIGNQTVTEGNLLSFTASASDADVPANTLTYSLSGTVPAGASISAGGVFTWTPTEAQGPGSYSFDVIVSDGTDTDSETITVTVNEGTNQAPVLAAIGNQTVTEGNLLSFTASASDADVPANTLTYSLSGTVPAGASISAGGVFTWTPTEAQGPGSYSFDVIVSDGTDTDSETITVTVNEGTNQAPVLAAIGNQTVTEGNLLSFTASASDADVPANTLTYSLSGTVPAGASISAGGVFTWTPTEAQGPGSYSFDVIVSDGTDTDSETITVTVNEVNAAPAGADQTVTTLEDAAWTFTAAEFGFTDPNDTPANSLLAVRIATLPGAGSLTLNGVAVTAGQTISVADINVGLLRFAPAANANGAGYASFTFQVQDDGGTANGGIDLDQTPNTLTVDVTPVTDLSATDDSFTVAEDTLLNGNVSTNDSTTSGGALTYAVATGVSHGSLTLNPDGSFNYTPDANWNGTDSFTYRASDGSLDSNLATVTLTVNPVNDAPTTTPVSLTPVAEDSSRLITQAELLANANDIDGPALTAINLAIAGGNGSLADNGDGTWTYIPAANDDTAVSFSYTISDGTASVAGTANLDITPNNTTLVIIPVDVPPVPVPPVDPVVATPIPPKPPADDPNVDPTETPPTISASLPAGLADGNPATIAVAFEVNSGLTVGSATDSIDGLVLRERLSNPETQGDILLQILDYLQVNFSSSRVGEGTAAHFVQVKILQEEGFRAEVLSRGAEVAVLSLSVGAVWWALSAGSLFASALTSLPVWRSVDVLPVLHRSAEEDKDEDGEEDERDQFDYERESEGKDDELRRKGARP